MSGEPPPEQSRTDRRTSDSSSYLVILVVVLAAYAPALANPGLSTVPTARMTLTVGLGGLYLILTTLGFTYVQEKLPPRGRLLYFLLLIPLSMCIFYLGEEISSGIWLLILPVIAQTATLPRLQTGLLFVSTLVVLALLLSYMGALRNAIVQFLFGIGAAMVFTVVFTSLAIRELEARREVQRLADELRESNNKVREYAIQAEELAVARERYRLAREIHDSIGHYLTAVNIQLSAALAVFDRDPEKTRIAVTRAQGLTLDGLAEVRRSVSSLRESPIGDRPLPDAIESLAVETRSSGVITRLEVLGEPRALKARTELTLFRAAQEGLTNARKHAGASRVDLLLDYSANDSVAVTVADNGVGASKTTEGFGLLGLHERVQLLAGEMTCETAPGQGFKLLVRLPAAEDQTQ